MRNVERSTKFQKRYKWEWVHKKIVMKLLVKTHMFKILVSGTQAKGNKAYLGTRNPCRAATWKKRSMGSCLKSKYIAIFVWRYGNTLNISYFKIPVHSFKLCLSIWNSNLNQYEHELFKSLVCQVLIEPLYSILFLQAYSIFWTHQVKK